MLKDAEESADISKHSVQPATRTKVITCTLFGGVLRSHAVLRVVECLTPYFGSLQAYNRKQSKNSSGAQQASKGDDDDDADSDSTVSGSSTDLVGKAKGAGGKVNNSVTDAVSNGNTVSSNGTTGAFDTSAIKSKPSIKRPPGGKVQT